MTSAEPKRLESAVLTEDQRRAVGSAATRICVNAGPGSGKTRVLVERVARGVDTGRLKLDRILALTFTENAASQMKDRLMHRFEDPAQRRSVEQAAISTIHGFCSGLLHDHAIEAGLDPRFRVLDEIEAGVLKDRVLSQVLDEFEEKDHASFEAFTRHFGPKWKDSLRKGCEETSRRAADPGNAESLVAAGQAPQRIFELVNRRLTEIGTLVKGDRRYRELVAEIQGLIARRQIKEAEDFKLTGLRNKEWNAILKDFREGDGLDTLPALEASLVEEAAAAHRRRIAELLAACHRSYEAEKARLSTLDFDDLERRAALLLSDSGQAKRASEPFDEILIDEYQDTSLMQAQILERMAPLRTFFVVGDPKQSIYAFRNAEPRNFSDAWKHADIDDGRLPLREDFRSRHEILAAVNTYFAGIQGFGGAPGFAPLLAGKTFPSKGEPSVEVLVTLVEEQRRSCEAAHLARLIRERFSDRYGSVAMLFRSTSDMSIYEAALREQGVPYFAETGRGFYEAREVSDVVNFLRVLDNDRDEIALATVLRSPMFGVSDDALYLLAAARAERRVKLGEVLGDGVELPEDDRLRVKRFQAVFTRLREESARRLPGSMVREIVAATGYEALLRRTRGGRRKIANLRKLADVARALGDSVVGIDSLGALTRAIDQFRKSEIRVGEAQVPASEGGVRLMTMHAAKGLEFPVVILPDLSRGPWRESSEIDYLPEFGIGCVFQMSGEDSASPTLALRNIRQVTSARDKEEEDRLLFVAMTRAEDHLILSGSKIAGRLAELLKSFHVDLPDRDSAEVRHVTGNHPFDLALRVYHQAPLEGVRATTVPAAPAAAFALPAVQEAFLEGQSDFSAAVTDVMEFVACPRRYYLGRYIGFAGEVRGDEGERKDEFPASERGTAVHQVLAGGVAPNAEVEALARRFHDSELGRRIAAEKNVSREEPVLGVIDGHFLRGILDLRAGRLIVDYKTGKPSTARYRLQMLMYALLTGATEACLFYLDEGLAVPVELTAESLEEARAVIGRFFDAQRRLDYPAVVADHCGQCPFSGRQCREPQNQ